MQFNDWKKKELKQKEAFKKSCIPFIYGEEVQGSGTHRFIFNRLFIHSNSYFSRIILVVYGSDNWTIEAHLTLGNTELNYLFSKQSPLYIFSSLKCWLKQQEADDIHVVLTQGQHNGIMEMCKMIVGLWNQVGL